jgi:hypothetical protein
LSNFALQKSPFFPAKHPAARKKRPNLALEKKRFALFFMVND